MNVISCVNTTSGTQVVRSRWLSVIDFWFLPFKVLLKMHWKESELEYKDSDSSNDWEAHIACCRSYKRNTTNTRWLWSQGEGFFLISTKAQSDLNCEWNYGKCQESATVVSLIQLRFTEPDNVTKVHCSIIYVLQHLI